MNAEDLSLLAEAETRFRRDACRSEPHRAGVLSTSAPVTRSTFSGPAGTGKTTLAMHVAAQLGRPVAPDPRRRRVSARPTSVGGQLGYRSTRVVDNYIHSVMKTEESWPRPGWTIA